MNSSEEIIPVLCKKFNWNRDVDSLNDLSALKSVVLDAKAWNGHAPQIGNSCDELQHILEWISYRQVENQVVFSPLA